MVVEKNAFGIRCVILEYFYGSFKELVGRSNRFLRTTSVC